ncbi:hypothetical protein ACWJKU_19660 (plasmid) [Methylocaldum sp. MU1018]|jgi:hypothetical protein|uniref:hypothetical protein n=1 Tax=Methylocaldum sp. RMAD-M TaxID=2806557 RepID=UPI0012EB154A|nr:hypothetical protein [Methylocaldum sp. RMAD-M]MBP1152525.1 hypothetical protein [Methylocaldum sp. RMAD-M]MVF24641.1 hypothetical protein [Methylocaldum sp. BRCS4]
MFLVDQRLLAKMWIEQNGGIGIEFHPVPGKGPHNWWEAQVVTSQGRARVISARGGEKKWRDIGAAIRELKEILPGIREMKVILEADEGVIDEKATKEGSE